MNCEPTRTASTLLDPYRISAGFPFSNQFRLENIEEPFRALDVKQAVVLLGPANENPLAGNFSFAGKACGFQNSVRKGGISNQVFKYCKSWLYKKKNRPVVKTTFQGDTAMMPVQRGYSRMCPPKTIGWAAPHPKNPPAREQKYPAFPSTKKIATIISPNATIKSKIGSVI